MRQLPHRMEKAQTHVLRLNLCEESGVLRFVPGPDGPHQYASAAERDPILKLLRIRTDRKAPGTDTVGVLNPNARIECDDTMLVGQQWVNVELDDLRHIGNQLRDLDQR